MNWLLSPPSKNDFLRLLGAWKFWLIFSLIGTVIGAAVYFIFPPDYRARATVVVDFNLEESWAQIPDRELFYYLERESRKLVEVAWADETVGAISQEIDDLTIASLRQEGLSLSHPQDGAWHFYADDADAARAEKIVLLWAESFNQEVQEGAANALALNALKTGLESGDLELADVEEDIARLEGESLGISAHLQTSLSQKKELIITRTASLAEYIFVGLTGMLFLSIVWVLFSGKVNEQ
ncbi:MAG: hypothetical protein HN392_02845 [Anaerolineae bacterium]|jgi:hypothetical protein|nr:hypothetical protein [Anaerolineae bacterium]MBT7074125.1 hypothetical protein [Anaerolineae bacterium]MBT7781346.1 hypothetical protein [Anaerolineae bacterium]